MRFVGIDLHKHSITVCVVDQDRNVLQTRRFACVEVDRIVGFFAALGPFQVVVEATASYQWLLERLEPLARKVVLAHPGKLRIIAESTRKSDKLDARALAEFLALDMIPQAYRPTPRQREHRALVRHRQFLQKERTQLRNKIRRVVSDYNADRRDLFSRRGLEALAALSLSESDRFIVAQLLEQLTHLEGQLAAFRKRLRAFATAAPGAEAGARRLRAIVAVARRLLGVLVALLRSGQEYREPPGVAA